MLTRTPRIAAVLLVVLSLSLSADAARRDRGGGDDLSDCVDGRLGLSFALDGSLLLSFVGYSQCDTTVQFQLNGSSLGAPIAMSDASPKIEVAAPDALVKKGKNTACVDLVVKDESGDTRSDRECMTFKGSDVR